MELIFPKILHTNIRCSCVPQPFLMDIFPGPPMHHLPTQMHPTTNSSTFTKHTTMHSPNSPSHFYPISATWISPLEEKLYCCYLIFLVIGIEIHQAILSLLYLLAYFFIGKSQLKTKIVEWWISPRESEDRILTVHCNSVERRAKGSLGTGSHFLIQVVQKLFSKKKPEM